MRFATLIVVLSLCSLAHAIDREALAITRYQLEVQIDRTTHVIAVTGKLTLRNDSKGPEKIVALQVSSSLAWNSITLADKPLPWLGENYTSDIDHTGSLSEVIVTLPNPLPPAASITLDVQYGGTITPDATRLTRMGAPADVAARNDWDEISDAFTAVRGLGYVVWYPVAIEAVSMSDGNAVFDAISVWKQRHARSEFNARIIVLGASTESLCIAVNAAVSSCGESREVAQAGNGGSKLKEFSNTLTLTGMKESAPAFAIANYQSLDRPTVTLLHLPEDTSLARDYALAAEANDPLLHDWLGEPGQPARVVELTEPDANPYQSGAILFTPLRPAPTPPLQLLLLPAQVAARFRSPHLWIQEGTERFLQAVLVDNRSGRKAALDFLDEYRGPLVQAEETAHPKPDATSKSDSQVSAADNTLLNTNDELYLRGKGSFVLWMLRDMLGDTAMQSALAAYHPGADKDPSYLQRLLQTRSKHDLEWFFDDWVYRDRGLPEFHVESAYARPLLSEAKSFLVTVTIEDRGRAGAEVPVLVQTPSGEKMMRVLVKAGQQGTGRIEVPVAPDKIVVNDGSVPTASTGNNVYNVPPPQTP
ncbi:MAG: hypothetical protein ABSD98_15365 [Candidatus Korobacteraceae bacterium]|jgi:hypothetical protein